MKFKTVTVKTEKPDAVRNGDCIRTLRKRHKISLRYLARMLGISAPYLSDMEQGKRSFSKERFDEAVSKFQS